MATVRTGTHDEKFFFFFLNRFRVLRIHVRLLYNLKQTRTKVMATKQIKSFKDFSRNVYKTG